MSLADILTPLAIRARKDITARRRSDTDTPYRSDQPLTKLAIAKHIDGSGSPIGVYFIKPGEDTCAIAALDLDDHDDRFDFADMMALAWDLNERLARRGLVAHPWRSGGGAGIHLWMLWETPQDAYSVRQVLLEVIEEAGYAKGSAGIAEGQIERFPAQDEVAVGSFGNQLWLPLVRESVPLLEHAAGDGYVVGGRADLEGGYEWVMSESVKGRARPARRLNSLSQVSGSAHLPELKMIEELLSFIKFDRVDDYSYDLWMQVGFAVHHAAGGSEDGFQLWAAWSALGSSCGDYEALDRKWRSLRNDGVDGKPVITIHTLEFMAREAGWAEDISDMFEPVEAPKGGENLEAPAHIIRNPNDHMGIARRVLGTEFSQLGAAGEGGADGGPCLWRAAGMREWFVYRGRVYGREIDEIIGNAVRVWLDKAKKVVAVKEKKDAEGNMRGGGEIVVPFEPTEAKIMAVFNALKAVCAPPGGELDPPCWIGGAGSAGGERGDPCVVLQDGILNLKTRKLQGHTPRFFSVNELPYRWGGDVDMPCPLWLKFLAEVFGGDPESADCLQEIAGYLLSGDTSLQKMFLIRGLPRSGKGTIERVLRAMLGEHNVAGTTLNQIGEDFGLWPLIDKSAVFISEARNTRGGIENRMALAVERLLMISGEDSLLVNVKGGKYYEGRLKCRVVMTANEVPALGDSTGAFASRFITLATVGSWLGREDAKLTEKLCEELPGILRWALDGLDRLSARGRFTQPRAGAAVMDELADMQNPIRVFLKECCDVGGDWQVEKEDLYRAYCNWFTKSGMGHRPTAQSWFSKSLKTAFRELTGAGLEDYKKYSDSKREWRSIRINDEFFG